MALVEVKTNVEYIKWSDVAPGTVLRGFYIETKPSVKYPDNNNHYVENMDGKRFGLNGSANLDRALEQVKEGWYIELTYEGETTLESGNFKGNQCHQFKLSYDDERIHPLFGGDASARQDVAYKNSDAPATPQPILVKPETSKPVAAPPTAVAPSPAVDTPQAAPAPSQVVAPSAPAQPKRSVF